MNEQRYIFGSNRADEGDFNAYSEKIDKLFEHQKENWDLLNQNYEALNSLKTKSFNIDGFKIRTQFNPSRIISSSAKVDKKSIENRRCFLCENNLPEVQKGINYKDKYVILCNPYPIFKQHLTIPHHEHIPQQIDGIIGDLLDLTFDLRKKFFLFYNGPKCGASAPDHLHFQAGLKKTTPLEEEFGKIIRKSKILAQTDKINLSIVDERVYRFLILQSSDKSEIINHFNGILNYLSNDASSDKEPLLNVISFYENNQWRLLIIPRKLHRPKEYFLEGDERFLISPASVDMAGLLITPREEDYNKIIELDIKNIYEQVLFNSSSMEKIIKNFNEKNY